MTTLFDDAIPDNPADVYPTVAALKKALGPSYGRAATAVRCRDCGAPVASGLDADVCAFEARVDPVSLTPRGEMQAALSGRLTYRARRTAGGGIVLYRRTPESITSRPACMPGILGRFDVWPEHRCGAAPLDRSARSILDPTPDAAGAACPY